jgi:hypothetical protein
MYKLLKDLIRNEIRTDYILYVDENNSDTNNFIPINPTNIDYQEYLKWVAEGNTPLPADE